MKLRYKIAASIILFLFLSGLFLYLSRGKSQKTLDIPLPETPSQEIESPEKSEWNPDSIPAMSEREYTGSGLKLTKVLDDNLSYTRHSITYQSEGLKISGILNVPKGTGPFPVIIMNHGYIEPKNYVNGQGLKREQDFFARNGYTVLHSDFRGYGFSDPDPDGNVRPRSDYVEDVLNAISAVKKSDFGFFDKENIGMLGHSMGGGVTINIMVTKPETAKAYVLLAPISSDYKTNFDKWVKPDPEFSGVPEKFYARYGTYEENPQLWESFSAKNYLDRATAPVMLHQGALDTDVPVQWSRDLEKMLKEKNKDIRYFEYPNEGHTFYDAQDVVMQRTLNFFNEQLKRS